MYACVCGYDGGRATTHHVGVTALPQIPKKEIWPLLWHTTVFCQCPCSRVSFLSLFIFDFPLPFHCRSSSVDCPETASVKALTQEQFCLDG